jgi:hypothetical protein
MQAHARLKARATKTKAGLLHRLDMLHTRQNQFNPYFLRLSSRVLRLMPRIAALLLIL